MHLNPTIRKSLPDEFQQAAEETETSSRTRIPSTRISTLTSRIHSSKPSLITSITSNDSHDPANPFKLPFHTIIARSHASSSTTKLFVHVSTLLRIPFFTQKLASEELNWDEDFYMLDDLDDASSLGLVFAFIQDRTVPSIIGQDEYVDVARKEQRVSTYIRAYPLAGKLGLENIQNQMVDRLIAYHLENPVSALNVGILVQAGVAKSKLGTLLMRELARGIIDGNYDGSLQYQETESKTTTTGWSLHENRDICTEDNQAANDNAAAGVRSHDIQVLNSGAHISYPRPLTSPRKYPENPPQNADVRHALTATKSPTTFPAKAAEQLSTTGMTSVIDSGNDCTILEQIRQSWTIEESTTLIAMMAKAHKDAKDPTNRSPMELAAADPCKIHIHSITVMCTRHESATGQKRKREVDDWDVSDGDESGSDENDTGCDQEDDTSSVHSLSSEIIEVQGRAKKSDKENVGPDNGTHMSSKKEVGSYVKPCEPPKKRTKLGWLFG